MAENEEQQRPRRHDASYRVELEHSFNSATLSLLKEIAAGFDGNAVLSRIDSQLGEIRKTLENVMATQAEFQTKIDNINANTTASAAAAQSIKTTLESLREEIKNSGLTQEQEATLLAALDGPIATSDALKTFLEATAAGPVTGPEPTPVEPAEPSESARRRG